MSFHLKNDPNGIGQYGLIAEEVDKVYPELVIRDDSGKIQGVRYDELAPMLLNEVQQQAAEIRDLRSLVVEMQAGLLKLQAKDELVAQRWGEPHEIPICMKKDNPKIRRTNYLVSSNALRIFPIHVL